VTTTRNDLQANASRKANAEESVKLGYNVKQKKLHMAHNYDLANQIQENSKNH
jgi:hypothetical protein